MKFAVIACHFNWAGFDAPRANLQRFVRQMRAAWVPVYGVEAHQETQEPFTAGMPGWSQIAVSERSVMFQKEALLNAAERMVPAHVPALAWVDADVWFDSPTWAQDMERALDRHRVVQPFNLCYWTCRVGRQIKMAHSISGRGMVAGWYTHPGFAMASHRDLWRQCGGIYDRGLGGAGDIAFAAALQPGDPIQTVLNQCKFDPLGFTNAATAEHYAAWAKRVQQWSGMQVGSVPSGCWHEWHGDLADRRYVSRGQAMVGCDVLRETQLLSSGALEWTDAADSERVAYMREYFINRREDRN